MTNSRLKETKAAASLNNVSPSTIVESREGTRNSLKTAIMETVSVLAKITPTNSALIQSSPRLSFTKTAMIPEESKEPGIASRAIGLKVLRRRLISVLIAASKIRIGRKRLSTSDGSRPRRWDSKSVMGSPASTKPVT